MSIEQEFIKRLQDNLATAAFALTPYFSVLKTITEYQEILELDKHIIEKLYLFEESCTELQEAFNQRIEFSTSGHYLDCLIAFKSALYGRPLKGPNVYFSDDGKMCFDLVRRIKNYL